MTAFWDHARAVDGIDVGVEVCLYSQPRLSCRCPDEIDNDLVAHQGSAPPIHSDVREQAMLDLVPFTGSWRIMTDSYIQSCLVGPPL